MKAVLIVAAVLLLVVLMTKSQVAGRSGEVDVSDSIAPVAIPASLEQSDEAGQDVTLVLLALLPEGFDSKEMQLDSGEYLFIMGNRTGLKEVSIRLDREGNERVAMAAMGGRQRNWKKRLKLTPGTYVVTADDHPDWTCRIVVGR